MNLSDQYLTRKKNRARIPINAPMTANIMNTNLNTLPHGFLIYLFKRPAVAPVSVTQDSLPFGLPSLLSWYCLRRIKSFIKELSSYQDAYFLGFLIVAAINYILLDFIPLSKKRL